MNGYKKRIDHVLNHRIPSRDNWKCIAKRKFDEGYQYAYYVPSGYSYLDVEKQIDALYATCGKLITLNDRGGVVVVTVHLVNIPNNIPFTVNMIDQFKKNGLLLGYACVRPIIHNLTIPHILIAGKSGYGKTDFLRFLLFQLITKNSPDECRIDIIDMKGFSFLPFKNIPHICNIVRDLESATLLLEETVNEMKKRAKRVWTAGRREKLKNILKRFVIIDEGAELSPFVVRHKAEKEMAHLCTSHMSSISRIGRETGIGLWYSTQYPTADVITSQVKINMEAVCCFRVESATQSEVVLGHAGAEKLHFEIPGRMIYKQMQDTICQVPYIGNDDDWEKLLSPYKEVEKVDKTREEEKGDIKHDDRPTDCIHLPNIPSFFQ